MSFQMVQIPGICDPEATIETKKKELKKFKLVLDFYDGALKIVELKEGEKLDLKMYTEIQELSDEEVNGLGKVIEDKDYDEDLDIHCDKCEMFYRPYCRKHPLYKIPDKFPNEDGEKSYSLRTLPLLFRVQESKIPNAGLGVFAETFIPIGMVFGPYKGVKCATEDEYHLDGYAWQINTKDNKVFYIDGSHPEKSNWLRYINSPRYEAEQNMLAFQVNGKVFYRVIKPIRINEEILVWYGSRYGGKFAHNCNLKSKKKNPFIW